ncbi:Uncharacterized protein OBRU01_15716 [Operophtera brumata]|uniref:FLYWCH-type domain-containing protein n=1 Tax=Operophtera brumata TaxID=104452 RepID=A0A0L7L4K2_OPEBR|nr:Uncharacterized protein OBRU01_15716 [Operophtera brumata]
MGYRFRKTKVMGDITYWKCSTHKCHAVIHTFTQTKYGTSAIRISGYTFVKQRKMGSNTRWRCSLEKTSHPQFILTQQGKPAISISGYRYVKQVKMGPKIRWSCAKKTSRGCYAYLHTLDDTKSITITKHNNNHSH